MLRMPVEEAKVITASSASARIIAAGIVIAFCYFASTVLVTLLVAVLMAYFLDPVVTWLENCAFRGRSVLADRSAYPGAAGCAGWSLMERMDQFSQDWPKYRAPLRAVSADFEDGWRTSKRTFRKSNPGRRPDPGRRGSRSSPGAHALCSAG